MTNGHDEEVNQVKIVNKTSQSVTVRLSAKETYRLSPAAYRLAMTFPAKERAEVVRAGDAKRAEMGHPKYAGHPVSKVWDHHIMAAFGVAPTPEAEAAYRAERGVRRPSVA